MLKGAVHLHSTYSDGEYTLAELRAVLVEAGCRFACMTDHAEMFDAAKVREYVAECAALSDEQFRFVAGLEFECERRMHILGLGVTSLVTTTDPQAVLRHIAHEQGVSVIAHPMDSFFPWIESFETLPQGIEAWNSKYDGRYAPRPGTFALLNRLQQRRPEMRAFYGLDLHWKTQYRGLFVQVHSETLEREALLAALARGAFEGVKDETLRLPADGVLPAERLAEFARVHARSDRFRRVVKQVKLAVKSSGLRIPAPLKAQLRRIF